MEVGMGKDAVAAICGEVGGEAVPCCGVFLSGFRGPVIGDPVSPVRVCARLDPQCDFGRGWEQR